MASQWYVARTKPRAERSAADSSIRNGLEAFSPWVHVPGHRSVDGGAPLFPGYLFVHYDREAQGHDPLRHVPEIIGLVSFAGFVPSVPDDVVAELARRADAINENGGLWTRFLPGDSVWVRLASEERLAEVVADTRSPQDRVRVLMQFLGGRVRAEIPQQDVRPAGPRGHELMRLPRRTRGKGRRINRSGLTETVAA